MEEDPEEKLPFVKGVSFIEESAGEKPRDVEALFNKNLGRLDFVLSVLGFEQSSIQTFLASWATFLVIGVLIPLLMITIPGCIECELDQIQSFEIGIVASQACMAAAALICISHNLRKYGIRKFLFVDRDYGHAEMFTIHYIDKISDFMMSLLKFLIPFIILKIGREILRFMQVGRSSPWLSTLILLSLTISSTYVTAIILSASILFHLVCSLQIIHLDEFGKQLKREDNVVELLQEHAHLRYYLSKISHRFRLYLITQFLIVTTVQFISLLKTTEYEITIINCGDYAVSSIVQVVVIINCLHAATKISHRAQGIGALASRWHAFMTVNATNEGSTWRIPNGAAKTDHDGFESDSEWLDFDASSSSTQHASEISSYHKRLSLVMYLRDNPGGITIFGWMVDRGLINTIFFLELSLVTFVLGKTVVTQG